MDRATVYAGAIPLETDILKTNQFAMAGLGRLAGAVLGTTGASVSGLACKAPSAPALSVNVASGEIYSVQPFEASAYSTLPADSAHNVTKQGHTDAISFPTPAPTTAGNSVVYLIQGTYADQDTTPQLLPYYNSANPTQPLSGAGGNGLTQSTTRAGMCVLTIKTGAAGTTGSQQTPAPDAGCVGLWTVTVAAGQTTVAQSNIAAYPGTNIIPASGLLGNIPNAPVISVAGRSGAITLGVGDVAGAAPLANPVFTGAVTAQGIVDGTSSGAGTNGGVRVRDAANNPDAAYLQFTATNGSTQYGWLRGRANGAFDLSGPLLNAQFIGVPTAPTAPSGTNTGQVATTAFVQSLVGSLSAPVTSVVGRTGAITLGVSDVSGAAPLVSPALTGSPTAPTPAVGDSSTNLATTAFAAAMLSGTIGASGSVSFQVGGLTLVLKWGTTPLGSGSNVVQGAINFPVAFPNSCFVVVGNADGPANNNWHPIVMLFAGPTANGCNYTADTSNLNQAISAGSNVRWIAIGN